MSKQLFNGIAYIANAIAIAAHQVASGYPDSPCCAPTPEPPVTTIGEPEQPKAKPGRPKKEVAAAPTPPAEPEKPATPEPEPEVQAEAEKGKGYDLAGLQALIKPLVESGQGGEVKKELAKFGVSKLSELVPLVQHHAEFAKDIEALSY